MNNRPAHGPVLFAACGLVFALVFGSNSLAESEVASPAENEPATTDDTVAAVALHPLATISPQLPPLESPPDPAEVTAAVERGIQFLLADQRGDGSWGSPHRTKGLNIYAPRPGGHHAFQTAVTALVLMALVEAEQSVRDDVQPQVAEAIERGEKWLDERLGKLRRATPDALYNVWGHAYAIQALVRLHDRAAGDPERQAKFKQSAQGQADMLSRYSFLGGGWSYYDDIAGTQIPGDAAFSFCTATVLIALDEAKALGVEFPEQLTERAVASIHRQLRPDFSYAYGEYTRMDPRYGERPGGSLGRSQVCNLALRLNGDERVSDDVMKSWLHRLLARNGWLSMGRKRPEPHESWFGVAGYYYYYGHFYAAMCVGQLPTEERPYFQDHLANVLLPLQERDGTWWDYPLYNYHQQYGTAMAIMTLLRCRH